MNRYTCTKNTAARVFYGDRLDPDARVGVSGTEADDPRDRLFGICDPGTTDRLTYLSYGLDYFGPADALAHCRERDGWFRFRTAAGRYGVVKISADDLEQAFTALGLLPQAAGGSTA